MRNVDGKWSRKGRNKCRGEKWKPREERRGWRKNSKKLSGKGKQMRGGDSAE